MIAVDASLARDCWTCKCFLWLKLGFIMEWVTSEWTAYWAVDSLRWLTKLGQMFRPWRHFSFLGFFTRHRYMTYDMRLHMLLKMGRWSLMYLYINNELLWIIAFTFILDNGLQQISYIEPPLGHIDYPCLRLAFLCDFACVKKCLRW